MTSHLYSVAPQPAEAVPPASSSSQPEAGADTFDALGIHPGIALYVGPRLRILRVLAELRQRDLAERIGVHGSLINLWEQDRRPIPHERIDAVAAALGTTPESLLRNAPRRRYMDRKHSSRDVGLVEFVVPPQPEPKRAPETVPPSARPSQRWCTAPHIAGGPRRLHSHGYAPSWAPGVGRIDLEP